MAGPQPQPLTRKVEEMLRAYLLRWGQRLVDLQPKVSGGGAAGVVPAVVRGETDLPVELSALHV